MRLAAGIATGAVTALLGACGGAATLPRHDQPAPYSALLGAGIQLLRQGNPQGAQQVFKQAVARRPEDAVAHYDLGTAYQQSGDRRRALIEYQRALGADGHYVPALFNAGLLYEKVDPATAMSYYRQAIAQQPDSPTAFLRLGLLELRGDARRGQALRDLRRALVLDPSLRAQLPSGARRVLGRSAG